MEMALANQYLILARYFGVFRETLTIFMIFSDGYLFSCLINGDLSSLRGRRTVRNTDGYYTYWDGSFLLLLWGFVFLRRPSIAINTVGTLKEFGLIAVILIHQCFSKFNADSWAPYTDDFYGYQWRIWSVFVWWNMLYKQSFFLLFSLIQNTHCSSCRRATCRYQTLRRWTLAAELHHLRLASPHCIYCYINI